MNYMIDSWPIHGNSCEKPNPYHQDHPCSVNYSSLSQELENIIHLSRLEYVQHTQFSNSLILDKTYV